jgi:hypothetical protein
VNVQVSPKVYLKLPNSRGMNITLAKRETRKANNSDEKHQKRIKI